LSPPREGALMRRHAGGRRCGARGREGTLLAPPGGPGQPSVPTTRDCPSVGWTRRGRRRAKACRIGLAESHPGPRPEVTSPGTEKPRWSAERRPRSLKRNAARRKTGAPLGAPSPRLFAGRKKEYGAPGAAQITRARKRALMNAGDGARPLR